MTVTAVRKDPQGPTMTIEAEFDASADRVWQLWADPLQLERWWGPPSYPATFTKHDLAPGSHVEYHMTGPTGDKHHGAWVVLEARPPSHLLLQDAFAHADGTPDPNLPIAMMRIAIAEVAQGRTRMSIESTFDSTEGMEKVLAMGMEEGMTLAIGQIDGILAEGHGRQ